MFDIDFESFRFFCFFFICEKCLCRISGSVMEEKLKDSDACKPLVNATLRLGSEVYSVKGSQGILSEQLTAMKEESMSILKNFITNHNVPNDVPDEAIESSSEDDSVALVKPPERPKKRK